METLEDKEIRRHHWRPGDIRTCDKITIGGTMGIIGTVGVIGG